MFNMKYLIPTFFAHLYLVQVTLCVEYTGGYPDELPNLLLEHDDERIEEPDSQNILENLRKVVRGYISLIDCWLGRVMHPFN